MATGKRKHSARINDDFLRSDVFAHLMARKNGARYFALYCVLIVRAEDGRLNGTAEDIAVRCRPFSVSEVRAGLKALAEVGLIERKIPAGYAVTRYAEVSETVTDWAAKKARQRRKGGDNVPDNWGQCPQLVGTMSPVNRDNVPTTNGEREAERESEKKENRKEKNQKKRIEKEKSEREAEVKEGVRGGTEPPPPPFGEVEAVRKAYMAECPSLPPAYAVTSQSAQSVRELLAVYPLDRITDVFRKAEMSDFLKGKNNLPNWRASFDWLVTPDNFIKTMNGNYDNAHREAVAPSDLDGIF